MLLDIVKVAELLGMSVSTVRRLRKIGEIPQPIQISSKLQWDKQEIIEFVEQKKRERKA